MISKSSKYVLMFAITAFLVSGCTSIHKMDRTNISTISLPDVISKPSNLENVIASLKSGKEMVVMVPKGHTVPLRINLALPIAETKVLLDSILFTQDVFLYFSKSKMRISPDGRRWADIDDMKSIKSLFSFSKGSLSIGFGADKDTGPFISVGIEAN